ncbi:outer membrane protein assembly factor BamC [Uliginosibacterium sp. H3]|uniref:Outer membrane protein assembly factor BamC n=1 Tax=Uliginosibacterium silvisoli TaxID=3114758 RepID=A0ABU6K857_9RHOO|nr:outer membrane protein assembly factor BamC [Uliginosibacterium sp. H3]
MKLSRRTTKSVQVACVLSLAGFSLVLGGCASNSKEYRSEVTDASRTKSLEVPPDLVAPTRDDRLQVPVDARRATTTASSINNAPKPEVQAALAASPDRMGKARIERAGGERWLVMPGTPQVVWPQLRKFWEDLGFTIKMDSPQLYVMETDWAEKRGKDGSTFLGNMSLLRVFISGAERDKFRTRLETSNEPGQVEVYVSHRALEEADLQYANQQVGWVSKPGDPGLELEMLRRMMVMFGSTEEQAKLAVAAPAATPDKARLATAVDGAPVLNVDDVIDRTWRQVGLALDRVGMVVEDRDRAKSIYFVRYITDEDLGKKKDSSWFSWMAFWRSDDKLSDTDQFRIVVQADGQKTTVRVQNKAGAPASPASSKQILTLLYNELK